MTTFLFNIDQKLSCKKLLTDRRAAWTKDIHCVVTHHVKNLDTGMDCYLVREYYYTDYNAQGETRIVPKVELEKEYVIYIAPPSNV